MNISSFSTDEVTPDKVNSIIKSLDATKAPGTDKIPMKLIILASDFLSKPTSKALNNCITSYTFPENAKVATVVPINKKTDDKFVIFNYRPVSLFNGFSKIYETHLKNHLVSSMNQHISNLVSAYRKNLKLMVCMKSYLSTFTHIFQIENNSFSSIMLQVISKQSYLGFHKAPLQVPFCLISFLVTSFILLKKQMYARGNCKQYCH